MDRGESRAEVGIEELLQGQRGADQRRRVAASSQIMMPPIVISGAILVSPVTTAS